MKQAVMTTAIILTMAGTAAAQTGGGSNAAETSAAQNAQPGIVAAIGPLIRQRSYEVGDEFVARFKATDADYARFFTPAERDGHAMFDLGGLIAMRLERAGVGSIDDTGLDTYPDERFYSYRRTTHRHEPDYGRHVHAIVLE